ncbi:MAG: helix-turn-helix domain-containing protein [Pseudonocardia sp.]
MRIVQETPESIFIRWLIDLRKEQGLSQASLAAKVGLDPTAITKIERGNRSVSLNDAAQLARALGHSLNLMVAAPPAPSLQSTLNRAEMNMEEAQDLVRRAQATFEETKKERDGILRLIEERKGCAEDGQHQATP